MTDPAAIAAFYRPQLAAHLYEVGDLDDAFWPQTQYWALAGENGAPEQIALLYAAAPTLDILLATTDPDRYDTMRDLLARLTPTLGDQVYAHLNTELTDVVTTAGDYTAESHGMHWKMALTDPTRLEAAGIARIVRLTPTDLPKVHALYEAAYPDGWYDARLLETGFYFGVPDEKDSATLLSVAGVHVVSERYGVATLGNVATHPAARGRGLARAVCAELCRELLRRKVTHIGLNVRTDNAAAVACYTGLGFTPVAEYEEMMLTRPTAG